MLLSSAFVVAVLDSVGSVRLLPTISSPAPVPIVTAEDDQSRLEEKDESEDEIENSSENQVDDLLGSNKNTEHADEIPVSRTFKFLMNVQLALIFFLGVESCLQACGISH
ncbi:hypothetical protein B0H13DRAFT_2338565 [Mycena leptocephala]|nr:hypothetical protein B0H13DRAFT_2338565 [Mycena leptocephala]